MTTDLLDRIGRLVSDCEIDALLSTNADVIDTAFLDAIGYRGQEAANAGELQLARSYFYAGRMAAKWADIRGQQAQFAFLLGQVIDASGAEGAEPWFRETLELVSPELGTGDALIRAVWLSASQHLASVLRRAGQRENAVDLMAETRLRANALGDLEAEFVTSFELLSLAVEADDIDAAVHYANAINERWSKALEAVLDLHQRGSECQLGKLFVEVARRLRYQREDYEGALRFVKREHGKLFFEVAQRLYYQREDYERALHFAKRARDLAGDEPPPVLLLNALFLVGNCENRLGRFEEAARTWQTAIDLKPDNPAYHANLSQALFDLGRRDEAVAGLREALRLEPGKHRQRLALIQILAQLDRVEEALAEIDVLLKLLKPHLSDEVKEARTEAEYLRDTPPQDLYDLARLARLSILYSAGRGEELERQIDTILADGDRPTRVAALRFRATRARDESRLDDAIRAYTDAVNILEATSIRLSRAEAWLELGDEAAARADLYAVLEAGNTWDPVIAIADARLADAPENPEWLKLRGYAYWKAWRPSLSTPDLMRAAGLLKIDAQAFYWSALSMITLSPMESEQDWFKNFNYGRLLASVEGFARALIADPDHAEALAALKWVVDRMRADPDLEGALHGLVGTEIDIEKFIPGYLAARALVAEGFEMSRRRDWPAAVERHNAAMSAFERIGLPVSAIRCHLLLADNHLRLWNLQEAEDHLRFADLVPMAQARPLTQSLHAVVDEQAARARASGRDALGLEFDYMGVVGIEGASTRTNISALKAQLYERSGNKEKALEAVAELAKLYDDLEDAGKKGFNFFSLIGFIRIMRDAGALTVAWRCLEAIEPKASTPVEKLEFASTRATLLDHLGRHDEAHEWYRRAHQLAAENGIDYGPLQKIQILQNLYHAGRYDEALQAMAELRVDTHGLPFDQKHGYRAMRARILAWRGDYDTALEELDEALALTEELRTGLHSSERRIAWQATYAVNYAKAVDWAVRAGDGARALAYAELGRARAFLEEVAGIDLPLSDEIDEAREVLDRVRAERDILWRLQDILLKNGPEFIDARLLGDLARLSSVDLIEPDSNPKRISQTKLRSEIESLGHVLETQKARIVDARTQAGARIVGPAVDLGQLRELLE
jgi:tetratricopeptide (TPR) repeat protein